MEESLAIHDQMIGSLITDHSGIIVKSTGDGFMAMFQSPSQAVSAAIEMQKTMKETDWGKLESLKIRIGIHTGEAQARAGDYFGTHVNRAARIMSAAHGDQIATSIATRQLASAELQDDIQFKDLGEFVLKGLAKPERIYQVVAPSLESVFPPLNVEGSLFKNFPEIADRFIAREDEIESSVNFLRSEDCRLLSIIGPGGCGKTRLSIEIADQVHVEFSHGALFVPLNAQLKSEELSTAIASALDFSFHGSTDSSVQLMDYLSTKRFLLVIDNLEHVPESVELIAKIISNCKGVKIIASSRSKLDTKSEHILRLSGLQIPESIQSSGWQLEPAIRLFESRAQKSDLEFELSSESGEAIIQICRLLDGMPLGIELAASWISVLPCEKILSEIKKNLDFLESSQVESLNQFKSLRAVFDYSWGLLESREQDILSKLSIFLGRVPRDPAEKIALATLTDFRDLLDKSLLQKEADESFRMQLLLRQFAYEKLDANTPVMQDVITRYCEYYSQILTRDEDDIRKRNLLILTETLKDIENISFAWQLALEQKNINFLQETSISVFYALNHLSNFAHAANFFLSAREVVESWNTESLDQQLVKNVGAKLNVLYAYFISRMGELDAARNILTQSIIQLREFGNGKILALASRFLANVEEKQGNFSESIALLEQSLDQSKSLGDSLGMANALNNLGNIETQRGKLDEAERLHHESLDLRRKIEYFSGVAASYDNLGNLALRREMYQQAKELYEQSVEITRELKDTWHLAITLSNLGFAEMELENYGRAQELHQESFELRHEMGDRRGKAIAWNNMGMVAERMGSYEVALNLLKQSESIRVEIGDKWGLAYCRNQMGKVCYEIGEFELAESYYLDAFNAFSILNSEAEALESILGLVLCRLNLAKWDGIATLLSFLSDHPHNAHSLTERARVAYDKFHHSKESDDSKSKIVIQSFEQLTEFIQELYL
jgi:predicted ATPase/predicted negative regulator of RcsB-dependent stress response